MTILARPLTYGSIDTTGSNQYADPDLPEALQGFPDLSIPPARKFNTLFRRYSGWCGYVDQRMLRSNFFLDSSATGISRLTDGYFRYATGAGLEQSVVEDSAYAIDGHIVDLTLDRLATVGLETRTFAATKDTHFYVASNGEITVSVVNVGVAASPPAGTYHLGTMTTDAVDCTVWTDGDFLFNFRRVISDVPWRFTCATGEPLVTADMGNADASGFVASVGTGAAAAGFVAGMTNSPAGASGIVVAADAGTEGDGISIGHAGAGFGVYIRHTGAGDGLTIEHSGAGPCAVFEHASGTAFFVEGNGGLAAAVVSSAGNNARGLLATGHGTAAGLEGRSGLTAGAPAVVAVPQNNTGFGFYCLTPVGSTTAARAGFFEGRGSGVGAEIRAAANHALILQGDTTSPSFAALRFIGANAEPSTVTAGSVEYVTTQNQLVVGDALDNAYRGIWTSIGGRAFGFTAPANGAPNTAQTAGTVNWVTAATATLTAGNAPKVAGRTVILKFTCDARNVSAGAANTLSVRFYDATAGGEVAGSVRTGIGSGDTAGFYLADTTTGWQRTIVYKFRTTVPTTGDRTYYAQIRATSAVEIRVRDCSLEVDGLH